MGGRNLSRKSVELVINTVASIYEIPRSQILGRSRSKSIALARQTAAYLLRELCQLSYPEIGAALGGRDHTTVIYAHNKISELMNEEEEFGIFVNDIKIVIEGGASTEKLSLAERPTRRSRKLDLREIVSSKELVGSVYDVPLTGRERSMLGSYRRGETLDVISGGFGITRERVRQIISKAIYKELAQKTHEGIFVDVKKYLEAHKKGHQIARQDIPEELLNKIHADIKKYGTSNENLKAFSEKYDVPISRIERAFASIIQSERQKRKSRWSRHYTSCKACGTTVIPHKANGYCQDCVGQISGKRRERIIDSIGGRCITCDIDRSHAIRKYGRDLYLTRPTDNIYSLYCKKCFLDFVTAKMLASRWGK